VHPGQPWGWTHVGTTLGMPLLGPKKRPAPLAFVAISATDPGRDAHFKKPGAWSAAGTGAEKPRMTSTAAVLRGDTPGHRRRDSHTLAPHFLAVTIVARACGAGQCSSGPGLAGRTENSPWRSPSPPCCVRLLCGGIRLSRVCHLHRRNHEWQPRPIGAHLAEGRAPVVPVRDLRRPPSGTRDPCDGTAWRRIQNFTAVLLPIGIAHRSGHCGAACHLSCCSRPVSAKGENQATTRASLLGGLRGARPCPSRGLPSHPYRRRP